MIVKIGKSGSSFKGAVNYYTHDPKAQTSERVDWTHTQNLANDHVAAAVDEMYVTAESAEWLKEQAGVRAGGCPSKDPVKPIIMSWAVQDNPSKEHMIESARDYLNHMGWGDHQAIMVAHNDKPYAHLHILLNAIHPETGKTLDDGFEKRRSQEWALRYELEQNRVHCTERLKNIEDREQNMPRNVWMEFKAGEREFLKFEEQLQKNPEIRENERENPHAAEWEIFKEIQRAERDQFYAEGSIKLRQLRNSIYREMRGEFRERWAEYYEAKKNGGEAEKLAEMKRNIAADQKEYLQPRQNAACAELMEVRKQQKDDLNAQQRATRAEFKWRLEAGLDNSDFFAGLQDKRDRRTEVESGFRETARETTFRTLDSVETVFWGKEIDARLEPISREPWVQTPAEGSARERDVADVGARRGVATVGAFADSLFFDLTNLGSARPEPISAEERADQFREAAENALKQQQQIGKEEEDERWRERQGVNSRE